MIHGRGKPRLLRAILSLEAKCSVLGFVWGSPTVRDPWTCQRSEVQIVPRPCRVVAQCTAPGSGLPAEKPRYVMGIGYPLDIVVCSALGADMYDSVYPTRTARFGVALVPQGVLKLKNAQYTEDFR